MGKIEVLKTKGKLNSGPCDKGFHFVTHHRKTPGDKFIGINKGLHPFFEAFFVFMIQLLVILEIGLQYLPVKRFDGPVFKLSQQAAGLGHFSAEVKNCHYNEHQ